MTDKPARDFGPNGERRIARARAAELSPGERAARDALSRKRWWDRNPEYRRQWREANPEKHRAHSRATYWRKKRRLLKNARARTKYAENPQPHRDRARRFRRDHPDKVAEYQRRYRERHPERAAEQSRRASQKWRDAHAEAAREKDRRNATTRREANPDAFRNWYHANIERERERGREASRLRSRLKALGLPPRKITRVYAADRRAHDAAAELFFSRHRNATEKDALRGEGQPLRPPVAARARIKSDLGPTPAPLLAEWIRQSVLGREGKSPDERRNMLMAYLREHGAALRDEVTLDSRARVARGAPPLDVRKEMAARAAEALSAAETARLTRVLNRTLASYGLPPAAALTGQRPSSVPPTRASTSPRSVDQNRER